MSLRILLVGCAFCLTGLVQTGLAPGVAPGASPIACVATPGAIPASIESGRSVSVTDSVTIHVTDHGFEPAMIEATNGHPLTIHLINQGQRPHGFRLDHYGIDIKLAPGATRTVRIASPDLGEYPFTSTEPCDTGMRGLLTFYI